MPKVWNKRDSNCPKDGIYVGRPSKWGNPFKIGEDGDRDTVILRYRNWLTGKSSWVNPLLAQLSELKGKDLVCWCAPKPCHADVLLELANSLPAAKEER